MEFSDDDLTRFEAEGALPLPPARLESFAEHAGARIAYAVYGEGDPVILLHGGLGHSGNWGHQLPALVEAGYQAILIDSRGHGHSTRDGRAFSYDLMASDVLTVMDALGLERASLIGWSDGACTALVLAAHHPGRVRGVFYFACNMDPSGTLPFVPTPMIDRCFARHKRDYEDLSATPDRFEEFVAAVSHMQQTQPDHSAEDLVRIQVPVTVAHSQHDEFIRREHAEYLARTIPGAKLVLLDGVSHFAPLQRPGLFNAAVLEFLRG
jgi:pimeloyl-ACP methyl ester carboxylesterase